MDLPKSTGRLFAISQPHGPGLHENPQVASSEMELNLFSRSVSAEQHVLDTTVLFQRSAKRGMHGCDDDRCGTIASRPGSAE